MSIHVTKSYLDMARSVIDTALYGDPEQTAGEDAMFSLLSCTYVFSFMALQSFCAWHLHKCWSEENSDLRKKYPAVASFEALMAGPLKEVKKALKELCSQLGIEPLHSARREAWRELNEMLKRYRDYFVHPNPESFHDHVDATGNLQWGFPSRVVAEIMGYFFEATRKPVPEWLKATGLRSKGFDVLCISQVGQAARYARLDAQHSAAARAWLRHCCAIVSVRNAREVIAGVSSHEGSLCASIRNR